VPGDPRRPAARWRGRRREGLLTAADAAPPTSLWRGEHRALSIGIVALITLVAFEAIGTATAMPVVAREINALGGYTWAFNAFIAASLLAMVVGGLWSDGTGPRAPLVTGAVAFGAGAVVAGAAGGLSTLVAGRVLQGAGSGLTIVAVYVLIARAYAVDLRPKAFSVIAAAWIVPSLIGPVVAGWLADSVSWRAVFWLVPLLLVPPGVLLLPRLSGYQGGVPQPTARPRLVAGTVATLALLAVQDGVLRLSAAGVAEAVLGAVALVASIRALLPPGALAFHRGLPASVMMRGLVASAYFSAEVFVPLALIETRGVSTTAAGLILATSAALWSAGSYVQSRLPGDRDRSAAVRTGATIVTVSLVTLPLSLVPALPPWIAAVSWAVGAFGMGLAVPSVSVQVMRLSAEAELGVNSAAIQIVDSAMSAVVVSVLGIGYAVAVASGGASAATFTLLWLGAALVSVAAILLAGRMRPSLSA
jgi:MFS family permease